jgi:hypothetical protein
MEIDRSDILSHSNNVEILFYMKIEDDDDESSSSSEESKESSEKENSD